MCKFDPKNNSRRIDPCMKEFMDIFPFLLKDEFEVVASCCGHGKYPMSIIIRERWNKKDGSFHGYTYFDLVNNVRIERKKKFYKKDKQGYYYIPEVIEELKSKKNKTKMHYFWKLGEIRRIYDE